MSMPQASAATSSASGLYPVTDYGAVSDGITDNTAAFMAAIAAANAGGGGAVTVAPGRYNFTGVLSLPSGVSLMGTVPGPTEGHSGLNGAVLFVSTPSSNPSAFITMKGASVTSDLAFFYPNQVTSGQPTVYPPVIQTTGSGNTCRNLYLENVYRGIYLNSATGSKSVGRDLIENVHIGVFGEAGILVDNTVDTSRISKVHLWPFYQGGAPGLRAWASAHTYGIILRHAEAMLLSDISMFGLAGGIFFQPSADNKASYGLISNLYTDNCLQGGIVATATALPQGWVVNNFFYGSPQTGAVAGINLSPGGVTEPGASPAFNIVGGSMWGGHPSVNWVTKGDSKNVCHLTAVLQGATYIASQV